ncbi:MAG TPA: hypothetical protein P5555_11240 [Candidatus Paceibacterota bacterium]|nr:hypothetical protein [Verrucomicrobiota bacterium]HOX01171.1 hypothetical protein [Verrucomicrobiota bacterium]HRZ45753.1 hypothetical protein [Candidatus Paceibacterota bacterium]HRZ94265.1 hypothetical protein [Candidatus Paceibacterota bacterium]
MRSPFRNWLESKLAQWNIGGKIGTRFANSSLVQLLLYSMAFRLALIGLGLLSVLFLAMILKVIPTSPAGVTPAIRVSGFDLLQSWSLRRTAEKATAARRFEDAIMAWRSAVANNPGSPELNRGLLQAIRSSEDTRFHLPAAVVQSEHLLRLTSTNSADLELVSGIFAQYRLFDLVLSYLEPIQDSLTPALETVYLQSLFFTGDMRRFADRWEKKRPLLGENPKLDLYDAAYTLGWGSPSGALHARQVLYEALASPALHNEALRLQFLVGLKRASIQECDAALRELGDRRLDTPLEHASYWRLLANSGRHDEAVRLAQLYTFPPSSALETAELADVYAFLGLRDHARLIYQSYAPRFSYSEKLWLKFASLLIEDQQWDALAKLALQLREIGGLTDSLTGFSYFLDGRATMAMQRHVDADNAMRKLADFQFRNPELILYIGQQLILLGYQGYARQFLVRQQADLSRNSHYWALVFTAAYAVKDLELMLQAAQQQYLLVPDDLVAVNNYAAVLLVRRTQSDEAVRLTMQLMTQKPNSAASRINHCLALVQSQRTDEAETLLRTVVPGALSPLEANSYHMAWLEIHLARSDWPQALAEHRRINPDLLFPNQVQWLQDVHGKITASLPAT